MESPITTERLILRPWEDEDVAPFAAMNSDPQVMEFFPSIRTEEQSRAGVAKAQAAYARDGFCMFAAELRATGEFIGFIGLAKLDFPIPGVAQPAVEIGWRLARAHWGKGLATEGARAVVRYAFETLRLEEIVAIAVPANVRSLRVMEKLGMSRAPGLDFDHPRIAPGHPLQRHAVYLLRSRQRLGNTEDS
jgi:RimJ/RimL family protein N-acetyltransferase